MATMAVLQSGHVGELLSHVLRQSKWNCACEHGRAVAVTRLVPSSLTSAASPFLVKLSTASGVEGQRSSRQITQISGDGMLTGSGDDNDADGWSIDDGDADRVGIVSMRSYNVLVASCV